MPKHTAKNIPVDFVREVMIVHFCWNYQVGLGVEVSLGSNVKREETIEETIADSFRFFF